jgi:hypothetical protein
MAKTQPAYFIFDYPPAPETFVIELHDPARIQEARDILSGRQTDRTHVTGIIVKTPTPYNPLDFCGNKTASDTLHL